MPYNFKEVENEFSQRFATMFRASEKGMKFYCLEMFPYPSGRLHMGHVRNYTIGDAIARFKRALGYRVLYPMGYDSFGLPAENAAIKHNIHPREWTERCIADMKQQQIAMGNSYDWNCELATHRPEYYKWNQYFFIKFFDNGLVYRKKAPANYCPSCKTVLANEQVIDGKCWRCKSDVEIKLLEQWFFKITKYADELLASLDKLDWPERIKEMQRNWIGKSEGTLVTFKLENNEALEIFTTRVDTIFGVSFIAIAPEHEKLLELCAEEKKDEVKKFIDKVIIKERFERSEKTKEGIFIGRYAINPLTNEKVPIYTASFVLPDYGTGIVMGVPAHDKRDYEFAKMHGLKIKHVIKPFIIKATLSNEILKKLDVKVHVYKEGNTAFLRFGIEEREKVLKLLEENKIIYTEISDRDVEKYMVKFDSAFEGYGILYNSNEFDSMNSYQAIEAITKKLEKIGLGKKAVEYKMRDWLISRQRYWGTPIPVVYCEKCGIVPVSFKDLPVRLPEKVKFGTGNPLETASEWINTTCPKCARQARRETDTMDTFVDSSWYFLRYVDNKNNAEPFNAGKIKEWLPVDFYIGGAEHATMHLIYARAFTKALRDLGFLDFDEPFLKLVNQGVVTLGGEAMSKSKGNIVDPFDVIPKYGADALRFFILFKAMPDKDLEWKTEEVESVKRFIDKIAELYDDFKEKKEKKQEEKKKDGKRDEYITARLNWLIKEYTKEISNLRFPYALIMLMDFVKALKKNYENISLDCLELCLSNLAILLNPITPYLSEYCWQMLDNKGYASLQEWPKANEALIKSEFLVEDDYISGIIADINEIKKITNKEPEKIVVIFADEWKFDVLGMIKECKKVNEAIAKIKESKYVNKIDEIIKILPKFVGKIETVLDADKEYKIVSQNKEEIEKEFKAKIELLHEKEAIEYIKYKEKARKAMPFKPVIILE
ncbi:MAG: class I tRNA ligase family protein [Candidatus Pacearchaeota archaeon]